MYPATLTVLEILFYAGNDYYIKLFFIFYCVDFIFCETIKAIPAQIGTIEK